MDGDLRALARSLVSTMTAPAGRALLAIALSDAMRLPQLAQAEKALFEDRFRRAEPVVTRAVERGELPAGTDPAELLKALAAPVHFRLVLTEEPVDETTAEAGSGRRPGRRARPRAAGPVPAPAHGGPTFRTVTQDTWL
ncbi:TetR-like C-terminal domain-containing protein [Streptomyces sp. NPDC047718]|uniref:TetR-like C-terminal domain-containing protein n=1 Tax=Streptomyces sp. NPDC047718 TaxID=3155479 RepID=UPI0033DA5C7F